MLAGSTTRKFDRAISIGVWPSGECAARTRDGRLARKKLKQFSVVETRDERQSTRRTSSSRSVASEDAEKEEDAAEAEALMATTLRSK